MSIRRPPPRPPAPRAPAAARRARPSGRKVGSNLALLPIVIVLTAAVVAVGLVPALVGVDRVFERLTHVFFGESADGMRIADFPERSTIYAADGSRLATVAEFNRHYVPLSAVNRPTRNAVLAIEDDSFYRHGPVDVGAILRAALANLRAGRVVQGGSTITQQLVKNTYTGGEQTFQRKFLEAQAAIRLERTYTKDQILEKYLNQVYFGNGAYGIKSAAEWYFAKEPAALKLPEAALLAGLIASPATWDPVDHPEAALDRRNLVLRRMHKLGWIGTRRYERAERAPIRLRSRMRGVVNSLGPEPYFVQFVKDQILHPDKVFAKDDPRRKQFLRAFGNTYEERARALFQGGLRIHTTLEPRLQQAAAKAVESRLPNQGPAPPADPTAAVVSLVPDTGAIQVMYGGRNFSKQKFNLATQSRRTGGSAFKIFTLAGALEEGVPVGKVYNGSAPAVIPESQCPNQGRPWTPSNAADGEGGGLINMEYATAHSINVYFAKLIADIGPEKVADVARRMGVRSYARDAPVVIADVCAITLGAVEVSPLSMTAGYATVANDGELCLPFAIRRVETASGETLLRGRPTCERVLTRRVARTVTSLLEGVITSGTASSTASIGRPAAGKTGTGQEYQDAWFVGYVPQLVTGVWVGYSKALIPMRALPVFGYRNAFGGTVAAPIWRDLMLAAIQGLPVADFPAPPAPKMGTVPDVIGLTQDEAVRILGEADFTVIVEEVDSEAAKGTVASQSPAAGAKVPLGAAVTIGVSTGVAPRAVVPDVIGVKLRPARDRILAAGFTVDIVYEAVEDRRLDERVLSQSPRPGTRREPGSRVTIIVGRLDKRPGPDPTPTSGTERA